MHASTPSSRLAFPGLADQADDASGRTAEPTVAPTRPRAPDGGRTPRAQRARALAVVVLLADKDLRSELRARSFLQAAVSFAVTVVLVFSFALGPQRAQLTVVTPGLLWVAAAFAAVFAIGRSFAAERDAGTLEGLLLYPVAREALFIGKALANLVTLLALVAGALLLMFLLYGLPAPAHPPALAAVVVLGSLGLATAGTFYGALSAQLAVREAFLPILVLPVVIPLVVAASRATADALTGGAGGAPWLSLLVAFDAVLLAVATALFRHVVEG